MLKINYLFSFFVVFALLTSCTIKVGNTPEKKISKETVNGSTADSSDEKTEMLFFIGPGDMLSIQVYGDKELTGLYQVSPEGLIMFPFAGEVSVEGMTNLSLARKIADKLRDGYIVDPQVTVLIQEFVSKRIFVLGQVKKAGNFPIRTTMSVIEAISHAGGFTDFADISNVVVTRRGSDGNETRFVLDIKAIVNGNKKNFYLSPGDIVFVRERFF
ncbi:MAG TPA: polysaccharide biosynthesis/export family protein [bacterium]|nr:polysaccharide biosynthesis/export family protein [bacterium]HPS29196.1 polysaccharide biosynthesis/export family protein [bacterium]